MLYINVNEYLKGQMDKTQDNNVLTHKYGLTCTSNWGLDQLQLVSGSKSE